MYFSAKRGFLTLFFQKSRRWSNALPVWASGFVAYDLTSKTSISDRLGITSLLSSGDFKKMPFLNHVPPMFAFLAILRGQELRAEAMTDAMVRWVLKRMIWRTRCWKEWSKWLLQLGVLGLSKHDFFKN